VRRLWISFLLPIVFCSMPLLIAVLLYFAVPLSARQEYGKRLNESQIDWIILGLGSLLFVAQLWLSWKALRWKDSANDFDEANDDWLSHMAQAAEWFPLLGLIGTVAAILQTFGSFGPGTKPAAEEIIQKYGPAITATGSGLFMAFLNILPSWIVTAARKIIKPLAGTTPIPLSAAIASERPGASFNRGVRA